MAEDVWYGMCDVKPHTRDMPGFEGFKGAAGSIVVVLAMARDPEDYEAVVRQALSRWFLIRAVEEVQLLSAFSAKNGLSEQYRTLEQQVRDTGEPRCATFHHYLADDEPKEWPTD